MCNRWYKTCSIFFVCFVLCKVGPHFFHTSKRVGEGITLTWESHSSSSWTLWSDARLSDDSWRVIGPGLPGGIAKKTQTYMQTRDDIALYPVMTWMRIFVWFLCSVPRLFLSLFVLSWEASLKFNCSVFLMMMILWCGTETAVSECSSDSHTSMN